MEIVNPAEILCRHSDNIADLAKSPGFGKGRKTEGKKMAAKSKKSRPSAFRDFPLGCGRNAPAMTREDLGVNQSSSEVHRVPVKGDADARNSGAGEGLNTGKLEDKQALTMLENCEKLDESGDVMPSQFEAKQPASETKIEKKKDGEGVVRSKSEAKQSTLKVKIDRRVDDEDGGVPSKSEAKQSATKAKIDRKGDSEKGVTPVTPIQKKKQAVQKKKSVKEGEGEGVSRPSESKQVKKKITKKTDAEEHVAPSKAKNKQATSKVESYKQATAAKMPVLDICREPYKNGIYGSF